MLSVGLTTLSGVNIVTLQESLPPTSKWVLLQFVLKRKHEKEDINRSQNAEIWEVIKLICRWIKLIPDSN